MQESTTDTSDQDTRVSCSPKQRRGALPYIETPVHHKAKATI